jgi:dTDP-glucose 4,6-dehydratase
LLVLAYFTTYNQPVVVTRASNNYGPYHFPEKLIPLMISNALDGKPLPVYGDGRQIRDWLFVEDHCRGIRAVLEKGAEGEVYNIGGNRSLTNVEVVKRILTATGRDESSIRYVADRPGHDRRYALSSEKILRSTGWAPQMTFEDGLAATVDWYRSNQEWVRRVKSGDYQRFYELNYQGRG